MDKEFLEKRLIHLKNAKTQAIANVNVIHGQITEVELMLRQINATEAAKAIVRLPVKKKKVESKLNGSAHA